MDRMPLGTKGAPHSNHCREPAHGVLCFSVWKDICYAIRISGEKQGFKLTQARGCNLIRGITYRSKLASLEFIICFMSAQVSPYRGLRKRELGCA